MRTVSDIIRDCGGAGKIADASKAAITADAVRKWLSIGIPEKHWAVLMKLAPGVTLEELYAANTKARKAALPPTPRRSKAQEAVAS